MEQVILFSPLLPWPVIAVLATLTAATVILALRSGLTGWLMRGAAMVLVLGALCGPALQQAEQTELTDIVLVMVDQSSSQSLSDRPAQAQEARKSLAQRLEARGNTEVRWIDVPDSEDDSGTAMMQALAAQLADEPRARIAGVFLISDGRIHDMDRAPEVDAPVHLLRTGRPEDWDRRLIVKNAPAFAIIGEPVILTLEIEDQGAAPPDQFAELNISVDGADPQSFSLPIGREFELPLTLEHGGRNVIEFRVPEAEGELTVRNNSSLIQINGVRDRLRVLLVSGEPHPGGRTWRNLLKSDSAVDLVHFTILRPPEKQDGVPVNELSLIAFPTRELFLEKIEDFDLIIFDRYKRRGILPSIYLDNVAEYVRKGGAVLVAAGPDFATASSIFRTPLADVLPARPTARVIEAPYLPATTEVGQQHPVTSDLAQSESWGRWLRQIEVEPTGGQILMEGVDGKPLLILDRVEEGRVALLASDHAWLWSRGYEGGGPQLELLRRLAHWMMKEPELEEEILTAESNGNRIRILRRTLGSEIGPVTITDPMGESHQISLLQSAPGRWEGTYESDLIGLFRLQEGEHEAVIGLGPAAPLEFEETIASTEPVLPLLSTTRGGAFEIDSGIPNIRDVRSGRPAAGRNWLGLTPRGVSETANITQTPLLPPWLTLLLALGLATAAWLREGRD